MADQNNDGLRSQLEQVLSQANIQKNLERELDLKLKDKNIQKIIDKSLEEKLPKAVDSEISKASVAIRKSLENEIKSIADQSFEGMRQQLDKDRLNVVRAAGLITIFIGFLVIQFNILKDGKSSLTLAGLSLILLATIGIFTLLLDLVIKLDLPLKKRVRKTGAFNALNEAFGKLMSSRTEEVDLTFNPKSWGDGLRIRVIGLIFCLLIGGAGVLMLVIGK